MDPILDAADTTVGQPKAHIEPSIAEQIIPRPSALFSEWLLRPDIVHLDHGSSGACPRSVFDAQTALRLEIERGSPDFFLRRYHALLSASKAGLARFLHADPANLALMPGTTHAMNAVLQSQTFRPGDELLTTSHAYASTFTLLEAMAERDGAVVTTALIPLVPTSPHEVLEIVLSCVTDKTRFAVIDHIPSRTALVYPIAAIVQALEARGVDVCVDGAHAPGQIALNLSDLNVPYYIASCHKWMCAPRGVGFLYVRNDKLECVKPVIVARTTYNKDAYEGEHTKLQHRFDWFGTFDPSAYCVLPKVVDWLEGLVPGGNEARMKANHELAVQAAEVVFRAVGIGRGETKRWVPEGMIPCMVVVPLPDSKGPVNKGVLDIQKDLWERFAVEVQVYSFPRWPARTLRFSCQAHNCLEQYVYLGECLKILLEEEDNKL
ncbi:MAG: hypothetical protein ASARMPREDX12_006754 [Alectoria sarmentosa]|nr:MAG: hypothetical protein ASARMPREDX12_006754 [Alectoria sarmentosa]